MSEAPCSARFIAKCGMAKWMVVDTLNTERVIAECARWDDASWIAKAMDALEATGGFSRTVHWPCSILRARPERTET